MKYFTCYYDLNPQRQDFNAFHLQTEGLIYEKSIEISMLTEGVSFKKHRKSIEVSVLFPF